MRLNLRLLIEQCRLYIEEGHIFEIISTVKQIVKCLLGMKMTSSQAKGGNGPEGNLQLIATIGPFVIVLVGRLRTVSMSSRIGRT
jgi:hypothetical protein